MPWQTAKQLRGPPPCGRPLPARRLFRCAGESAPVVLDQAAKEPLLVVVGTWVDEVGQEPALALGGLLTLRDTLRADLAESPPD
jgi:hypothetical protein